MYLIDESYFIREIHVPNTLELQGNSETTLEYFIDEKVRLLLSTKALGATLFTDFNSYVVSGVLSNSAPQKWKDLVNGKSYTKDGKNYIWKGLLQTEGTFKKSLLAYYTYFYWVKANVSVMAGTGESRVEAKNAVSVNSTQTLTSVWNEFVSMYQGSNVCQNGIKYVHNGVVVSDYFNENSGEYVSLIDYLTDNKTDYLNARCELFDFKNYLGL